MKGKIDVHGALQIYRSYRWKDQTCPFGSIGSCGDWCPLFGEPVYNYGERPVPGAKIVPTHILPLCFGQILTFLELEDDRPKKETP